MDRKEIVQFADFVGNVYSKAKSQKEKKDVGQFFTPPNIAEFMGQLCNLEKESVSILDPGCGCLILSSALINHLSKNVIVKKIELTLYESDIYLKDYILQVLDELENHLRSEEIEFKYNLYFKDFVLENAKYLIKDSEQKYDVVISNPPFFKVRKNDELSKVTDVINSGQPNIYAMFMGISARLLENNGELIFIVPRSFTSGLYFKKFRKFFLQGLFIERIHLFVNRSDTFKKEQVLQELLILKGTPKKCDFVEITTSDSRLIDLNKKYYPYKKIVNIKDNHSYIHIPTNDLEVRVLEIVSLWTNKLEDFDLKISTGPVVDFRSKEDIAHYLNLKDNFVPYLRLNNVKEMLLLWPDKTLEKEQIISNKPKLKSILRENKNYILLRRQSAKGDKKRLISAPFECDKYNFDYIGIDNKLNYIYGNNRDLSLYEIYGISAFLNSDFMNTYFQIFNGNINVSATEIRELKFPDYEFIKDLGRRVHTGDLIGFANINSYINTRITYE